MIITDSNVNALYGDHFQKMPVIVIEAGEELKRIELIERILNDLLQLKADRSTFILGIGGGVVPLSLKGRVRERFLFSGEMGGDGGVLGERVVQNGPS